MDDSAPECLCRLMTIHSAVRLCRKKPSGGWRLQVACEPSSESGRRGGRLQRFTVMRCIDADRKA